MFKKADNQWVSHYIYTKPGFKTENENHRGHFQQGSTNCGILQSQIGEILENMENSETSTRWVKTLFLRFKTLYSWLRTLYFSTRWLKDSFLQHLLMNLRNHNIIAWRTWSRVSSRLENIKPWFSLSNLVMKKIEWVKYSKGLSQLPWVFRRQRTWSPEKTSRLNWRTPHTPHGPPHSPPLNLLQSKYLKVLPPSSI